MSADATIERGFSHPLSKVIVCKLVKASKLASERTTYVTGAVVATLVWTLMTNDLPFRSGFTLVTLISDPVGKLVRSTAAVNAAISAADLVASAAMMAYYVNVQVGAGGAVNAGTVIVSSPPWVTTTVVKAGAGVSAVGGTHPLASCFIVALNSNV